MLDMRFVIILAALCHCALSFPYEGTVPMNVTHNFVADHQTFYFGSNAPTINNVTSHKECKIPDDYKFHDGFGAYKFHDERSTDWETARKACIAEGAHLAIPRSKAELAIIKGYVGTKTDRWAWVGYYAILDGSEFYSVLDKPIGNDMPIHTRALARMSGESMGDRCVLFTPNEGLMRWFCEASAFFICKIDCEEN